MNIIESHLQSKFSPVPDEGGEDRLVVTDNYAAVIDGVTARTDCKYNWDGKSLTPGGMAAEILARAVLELDPDLSGLEACMFLNNKILDAYSSCNILEQVKDSPVERFNGHIALYNKKMRYVALAGECQTIIGHDYYHLIKKVEALNANARADEITRLINEGKLTEEMLLGMDINQDPGRQFIMKSGKNFPGLIEQVRHQNDPLSPYGYFMMDGFANFKTPGFKVMDIPDYVAQIVLATDGYIRPDKIDPADSLYNLGNAERDLNIVLTQDPCCYKIHKGTKGKGIYNSFDDRAYIRIRI